MKIASLILMALVWLVCGVSIALAVFWHGRKDTGEMTTSVVRAVFNAVIGIAWILIIYERYMT